MNRRNIRLFGIMIIVGYAVFHFINFLVNGQNAFDSKSYADLRQERTSTYLDIFKDDIEYDLVSTITSFSNRREPISYFLYQDANYKIAVWEVLTNNNVPLTVQVVPVPAKVTAYKPYEGMVTSGFNTYVTQDTIERRDTVFLYLKGDSLKEKLINDSLLTYSLFLKDMSLSFEKGGPLLFSADPKLLSVAHKRPSEIAFYRNDNRNYVILMFPIKDESKVDVKLSQLLK